MSDNSQSLDRRSVLQQSLLGGVLLAGAGLAGASQPAAAQAADTGMVRRVVTGNNAQGKSYIVKDEMIKRGAVWSADPSDMLGPGGAGDSKAFQPSVVPSLDPPTGGTKFMFVTFAPSKKKKGDPLDRNLTDGKPNKDGFHRTATIDYVLIADGEVTMHMDEGETTLHAGDIVIQRNTSHAWQNYSTKPTTVLVTMVRI